MNILIVDDNHDQTDVLARLFQLDGHTVHVAYDGAEAVRLSFELRPEVIVMDLGMPKLSGCEAARMIRKKLGNRVRLIALSGWDDDKRRIESAAAGFEVHLAKPTDFQVLKDIVLSSRNALAKSGI